MSLYDLFSHWVVVLLLVLLVGATLLVIWQMYWPRQPPYVGRHRDVPLSPEEDARRLEQWPTELVELVDAAEESPPAYSETDPHSADPADWGPSSEAPSEQTSEEATPRSEADLRGTGRGGHAGLADPRLPGHGGRPAPAPSPHPRGSTSRRGASTPGTRSQAHPDRTRGE